MNAVLHALQNLTLLGTHMVLLLTAACIGVMFCQDMQITPACVNMGEVTYASSVILVANRSLTIQLDYLRKCDSVPNDKFLALAIG